MSSSTENPVASKPDGDAADSKPSSRSGGNGGGKDTCKALVVGIPNDLTDKGLEAMCRGSGKIKSASVVMDQTTGKSKGFGFVEFVNEDAVEAVVKRLNGTKLGTRTLNVRALQSSLGNNQTESQRKKTKRPCFSFVKKGRCTKGDNCRYSHFTNSSDARTSKGKGKDETGNNALRKTISTEPERKSLAMTSSLETPEAESNTEEAPVTMKKVPEGFCFLYQRGSCHRGKACRFKHEKPDGEEVEIDTSKTQTPTDEVFVSKKGQAKIDSDAKFLSRREQEQNLEDDLGISSEESSGEDESDDENEDSDDEDDDEEDEQEEEEDVVDEREEAEILAAEEAAKENESDSDDEDGAPVKKRKAGASVVTAKKVNKKSKRGATTARAADKAVTPMTDGAVWLGMDGKPLKLQEDDDGTYVL